MWTLAAQSGEPSAGVFNFSAAEYRATEREAIVQGTSSVSVRPGVLVTVTRTMGATGRVLVDYSTDDDCALSCGPSRALPNDDYEPAHGTLLFDDYQMSASFLVRPISHFATNASKSLKLFLSNPRCALEEDPAKVLLALGPNSNASRNCRLRKRHALFLI